MSYDVAPADRSTLGAILASSRRDLTGNVDRPVTITGTTSKPTGSVNQQKAVVSGTTWRFDNFFLHEGTNLISTASATVSVDQTAPFLSVEAPLDNAVTSADTVDVRGTVSATDQAGKVRSAQFRITRIAAGAPRLTVYGGNGQAALAGGALATGWGGGKLCGEWTGATGMVVVEFNDGVIHVERNWTLGNPKFLPRSPSACPGGGQ